MFNQYVAANPADFGIPTPYSRTYTYVDTGGSPVVPPSDDALIGTITYKNADGTTLGVITITYVGTTNNISTMTRTS